MRDDRIDVLRFLGLALIILAHTNPVDVVFQLRNFDVPLMVIVSGMSFRAAYRQEAYLSYLFNRIKRLLFPVWLFLSIYFVAVYLTGFPIALPSTDVILSSFMLLEGIGYVWIIRVFLMVAMISPFLYRYSSATRSNRRYLLSLLIVYLLYEIFMSSPLHGLLYSYMFENSILYVLPYSVVFALGLRLPDLDKKQLIIIMAITLCVFACWAGIHWNQSGKFIGTQAFKYPPRSYYLTYAIFASTLAWHFSARLVTAIKSIHALPVVLYIAQNSIWVYLWHIPLIQAFHLPSTLEYPLVFSLAATMTYMQVELVKRVVMTRIDSDTIRKNVRILLTG